jgi:hypothetical protein
MIISAAFKNKDLISSNTTDDEVIDCDDKTIANADINIKIPVNQNEDIPDTMIKISALGGGGAMSKSKGWSYEQKQQVIRYHGYILAGHSYFGILS